MSNSLVFPILRLMADGRFHSGEALANRFQVSRATIWNAISEAEKLGVTVFSVRGKGYRLPQPVNLLDRDAVLQAMTEAQRQAIRLEVYDQIDSTNSALLAASANGAEHGSCIAALYQTQGRGRRGRVWQSALGDSLTFSLLWRFQRGAAGLSGLSLAVGVALMRALQQLSVHAARLKWPNDVLIEGKKLAGILIELQGDMESASAAVIGVGINLRLPRHLKDIIDQPAIALQDIVGEMDPNVALGTVLTHMMQTVAEFDHGGFALLREEWLGWHAYQDLPVRLLLPNGTDITGIASGVDEGGVLLVNTPEGERRFASGEVSLRELAA